MPESTPISDIHASRILILDFGSQYTQLIARRIREIGVYSEIMPFDVGNDVIRDFGASGIVLSGGPESVGFEDSPRIPEVVFDLGIPLLGICYGMQAMAAHYGGTVDPSDEKEFGYAEVAIANRSRLLDGIEDRVATNGRGVLEVWMSHGDKVTVLPEGFKTLCTTGSAPIAGMADRRPRLLRPAVPPGGNAYRPGPADPRTFRARDLRLRR